MTYQDKIQKAEDVLRDISKTIKLSEEQCNAVDLAIITLHISKTVFFINANLAKNTDARNEWHQALMLLKDRIPNKTLVDLFYLGEGYNSLIKELNQMKDCDLKKWVDVWNETE